MNSEELELSLRSEFEGYLNGLRADMRREAAEFQTRVADEMAAQRTRFDEVFSEFTSRFDGADATFDEAFKSSVAEHLRLARDEGARITADAMAEAERLAPVPVAAAAEPLKYDLIKDAVDDISSKDSQSAILKSLVQHAGKFAPRGAFFIIKNEQFVGWKTFDADGETANNTIREINFPVSNDSILGAAASTLRTADRPAGGDGAFLAPLQFGQPENMFAIPLVAREKGVAVLYADRGENGGEVGREALETLVRVAGLTVELLAYSNATKSEEPIGAAVETSYQTAEQFDLPPQTTAYDTPEYKPDAPSSSFAFDSSTPSFDGVEPQAESTFEIQATEEAPPVDDYKTQPYFEAPVFEAAAPEPSPFQMPDPFATSTFEQPQAEATHGEMVFDSGGSIESAAMAPGVFEPAPAFDPATAFEPAAVSTGGLSKSIEPIPGAQPAPQARRADRPVDLPIEVPDDERRIHNDARRFARLLVSEIKLYNEKKVTEGRQAHDLYERLREAIDRSREMYDKRVQPPVAAKFDYFHYELVNALADGDSVRLGSAYPGSTV